jgi:hypothetical protein
MPIENRDLKPGTKFFAKYRKQLYHADVVEGEEGKARCRLKDGREFRSPSAAGSAIMDGKACNGWRFWSVEESYSWAGEGPSEETASAEEPAATEEGLGEQDGRPAAFKRTPNQRGVSEGSVRLYCDACQMSFTAPTQDAEHCPEGHRPDCSQFEQEATEG